VIEKYHWNQRFRENNANYRVTAQFSQSAIKNNQCSEIGVNRARKTSTGYIEEVSSIDGTNQYFFYGDIGGVIVFAQNYTGTNTSTTTNMEMAWNDKASDCIQLYNLTSRAIEI